MLKKQMGNMPLWLALAGLACFAAFAAIGSRVDEQGILREPFFLMPAGWLLLFLAAGWAAARWLMGWLARR